MNSSSLPSTPERIALDPRLCRAVNRWGNLRAIGKFFGVISRLGDGWFWYALMAHSPRSAVFAAHAPRYRCCARALWDGCCIEPLNAGRKDRVRFARAET